MGHKVIVLRVTSGLNSVKSGLNSVTLEKRPSAMCLRCGLFSPDPTHPKGSWLPG